ncbi:Histone H2A [Dictyocoela roeselum]|nr:Histone H2A [Dictyocoela roeselum]
MASKGGKKDPALKNENAKSSYLKASHLHQILHSRTGLRVSKTACLALSTGLTYMITEIVEGSKSCAEEDGKKKILPRHINLCIGKDQEIAAFGKDWLIRGGGTRNVIPSDQLTLRRN